MNGFSSDVNVLIGFYYETHAFHSKVEEFFKSLKGKYKTYVFLESVGMMFRNKISQWSQNAVSLVITTIAQVRSEIKGEIDIIEFNKRVEGHLEANINEYSKTDPTIDPERVRYIINQIVARYTYYDLIRPDIRRAMMTEFYIGKEEDSLKVFEDLKNLIKAYFSVSVMKMRFDEKIKKIVKEYFKKANIKDVRDDELIAEDLLCNYENKISMFATADKSFYEILKDIIKNESFKLEIINPLEG
jgi:predicted nucleic-acid-binding protein